MVCDFARFRLHDLETGATREFALKDLHRHIRHFGFIAGYETQDIKPQNPVNIQAAERMGRLHDALKASGYEGHALEVLLVRLLFCLFDAAVDKAYGKTGFKSDAERVAFLFQRYQALTSLLPDAPAKRSRKKPAVT